MPKISILVPIYNVEKYLKECLDSIINQTFDDIEIICINDGSKDNCPQIINEYVKKDDRIVAIHKGNCGYGSAMNVGLAHATGEYVAIVEPDDYIESTMYEDLYKIAKAYDSDIVKSCFYDNLQCKQESKIKKVHWKDFIPEDRSFTIKEYPYFLYYHPSIWSCIYKREFLIKHSLKFVEAPGAGWTDNPFQVQTMCLAERINYTSKAYYYWRRLNYFESDDLKDYTIPFKRTEEIHQWLEKNNINDEGILVNLYRRELTYINIVLGKKTIPDMKDCYARIEKLVSRIPYKTFINSKIVRNNEKNTYKLVLKNPKLVWLKIRYKSICRKLISIHLNKIEQRIILFGKHYTLKERNNK